MTKGRGKTYPTITIEEIKHASGDIDWFTIRGLAQFEYRNGGNQEQKVWALYKEIEKHPDRFIMRTLDGSTITIVARIKAYTPKTKKRKVAEHIPPPMRKFIRGA